LSAWRALSPAGGVSRTLPSDTKLRARQLAEAAVLRLEGQALPGGPSASRVVVGLAKGGGLRVQLKSGSERALSLSDLGWCLLAEDDVRLSGGVLDEVRVNRLRYLEGTERSSTRWIDTGHTLAVLAALRRQGP
jgi:hypothetical protein